MSSANEIEIVPRQELLNNVVPERVANSSRVSAPPARKFHRNYTSCDLRSLPCIRNMKNTAIARNQRSHGREISYWKMSHCRSSTLTTSASSASEKHKCIRRRRETRSYHAFRQAHVVLGGKKGEKNVFASERVRSSFYPQIPASGSDQSRSHSRPSSGTSMGRGISRIWPSRCSSGLIPPCMQRILSSTSAATGMQLKQSENTLHSFTVYRRLHSS